LKIGQVYPTAEEIEGNCRIEGIFGEGGKGLVYKAFDFFWHRHVVIKTPRQDYVGDEYKKSLFMREAEEWVKLGFQPAGGGEKNDHRVSSL